MLGKMKWVICLIVGTSMFLASTLTVHAAISADTQATQCPALQMKHWKDSSEKERYAFLLGFVTMLELEREWQGDRPLPIKQSLNNSWVKGLSGVTLHHMYVVLDAYLAKNPQDLDKQVVEVLWFQYVQPKLTPAMKEEAKATYNRNRGRK